MVENSRGVTEPLPSPMSLARKSLTENPMTISRDFEVFEPSSKGNLYLGGFKHLFFTLTWGIDPIWRAYFSNGLVQPPASFGFRHFLTETHADLKTRTTKFLWIAFLYSSLALVLVFFTDALRKIVVAWREQKDTGDVILSLKHLSLRKVMAMCRWERKTIQVSQELYVYYVGGGFKYFSFLTLLGEDSRFDEYFLNWVEATN